MVIIDEASQSDVTALAALYLRHEHIVVGDKEQVTPDAIGQGLDQVERLVSTDLQGIPNCHLYDGQTSIYDLAETAFGSVVALPRTLPLRARNYSIQQSPVLPRILSVRCVSRSASVRPAVRVAHRVNGFREKSGKTTRSKRKKSHRFSLPVSTTQNTNRTSRAAQQVSGLSHFWATTRLCILRAWSGTTSRRMFSKSTACCVATQPADCPGRRTRRRLPLNG